ncbi:hypothetical protein JVT61DRAFT_4182 [Boletus reticuloceps]|uniref:Uncharacterized protein n=1 Tax=Boletus reticuloceps TaxID=495285 RepID=A0A8I2YL93_9AGAM|nr:hypothetical protein JVT61DRAFT_4182 [Boletus reticuloceps]
MVGLEKGILPPYLDPLTIEQARVANIKLARSCPFSLPHSAIMFHPSSDSASSLVHMLDCDPLKQNPGHLYLCQPHTIQIIQLVEATPPPRCISSVVCSSSTGSSSISSYPSTSDSDEDCTSYCSSIVTPDDSSHNHAPIRGRTIHTARG